MSMIQQPNEDGEMESPDTTNRFIEGGRNPYAVAQLPVAVAETHQQQNMFSRSISMPLPENKNASLHDSAAENLGALPTRGIQHSDSNGEIRSTTIAKIEHIKNWSISTYKCTKQFISEKLGKTSRTVDTELGTNLINFHTIELVFIVNIKYTLYEMTTESQIEILREVQRKYSHILRLSRALSSHFQQVNATFVIIIF